MFGKGGFGFEALRERWLGRGDLKYVILDVIKDKPQHGYEIMRILQERAGGFYTASPGSVYPTLQMLEDMGHVTVTQQDGKRIYAITDEGREFLAARGGVVEDIWARTGGRRDPELMREFGAIKDELRDLARLFAYWGRARWGNPERVRRIRTVITQARKDIERILAEDVAGPSGE